MSFQFSGASASHSGTTVPDLPKHVEGLLTAVAAVVPAQAEMQLIRTRAAFEALETEWNALFDAAARPEQMFQSFNWLWHWTQHFTRPDTGDLAIVTIRRSGQLVGVLPMVLERACGLRQLAFMGDPVGQYGDVLSYGAAGGTIAEALRFAIQQTRSDLVRLAKVRDGALIAAALAEFDAVLTASEEAPFIDLTKHSNFDAYQKRFSSKALKNRRRLDRRLEERGPVVAQWDLVGEAGADAALATFALKRTWLKERGQLSRAFADQRTDAFFASVCAQQVRPAGGNAAVLRPGTDIANAAITVTAKGTQVLHILAYDRQFEKCSPGVLHIEKMIARAFEQRLTTFDFLAPRHDYKTEWADGAVRVADYAIPVTALGRIYTRAYLGFAREHMKGAVKAAANHMRGPLSFLQSAVSALRR
jgi:CelD/BcsL family acetyltransferase involved in cellulose biosynthesis